MSLKPHSDIPLDPSTKIVKTVFFVLAILFVAFTMYGFSVLAVPLLVALLLAFALFPAVNFTEGLGLRRGLAILLVLALLSLGIYLFVVLIGSHIREEFREIVAQQEEYADGFKRLLEELRIYLESKSPVFAGQKWLNWEYVSGAFEHQLRQTKEGIPGMMGGFFTALIVTPIVLFILLLEGDEIYKNVMASVPNRYFELCVILTYQVKKQIASYFRGLALQWLIMALILGIGLSLADLPHAILLALAAATLNVIPYVGPLLGLAPAIGVAVLDPSGSLVLPTIGAFAAAHLVDNLYSQPVLLARSAQIHPLIAVLSVITFDKLFGIAGMVVAIPIASILLLTLKNLHTSLKAFRVI